MKAKRRIKKASITHISLVDKGANAKTIIWKSGAEPVHSTIVDIRKTDDEQHMVYGIVYSPDQVDNQGDVADAAVIKDMAHNFMKSRYTTNVDRQHDFISDEGYVAESWIVRKGDAFFKSEPEDSWAVGVKVEKDETWELVKSGEISGISMAGFAEMEELEKREQKQEQGQGNEEQENLFVKFAEWLGIRKDFDANIKSQQVLDAVWSLQRTLEQIESDADLDDKEKQKAMLSSVDQFKAYITGGIQKNEVRMKPEEISQQVTDAVTKALEPVTARLDKLEKADTTDDKPDEQNDVITAAVEKALEPVTARLEALEKASPGSKLVKGQEPPKDEVGLSLV